MQPAASIAAVESLLKAGRTADAVTMMSGLAEAGDANALFALGLWRLGGRFVPIDLALARDLFRRAGETGRPDGTRVYLNFLASGTGGPADWPAALALAAADNASAAALALIGEMTLDADGAPLSVPAREQLSESPHAEVFPGLFTAAECDYLVAISGPLMQPSVVVDERTGRLIPHPIRTSDGAAFP